MNTDGKDVTPQDINEFKNIKLAMGEEVSATNLDDDEEAKVQNVDPVRPSSVGSDDGANQ